MVRVGLLVEAPVILGLSVGLTTKAWAMAVWLFVYGIGVGIATAQLATSSSRKLP